MWSMWIVDLWIVECSFMKDFTPILPSMQHPDDKYLQDYKYSIVVIFKETIEQTYLHNEGSRIGESNVTKMSLVCLSRSGG